MYFGVGKIKRLRDILPRYSLVTIYKSFIRPDLHYGDVIYDQPNNDSFTDKIEQLQYKACLAIIRAIQGTSRKCLYNKLRLKSLSSRRWCRKLCTIYKLLSTQCPKYLFDIIPSSENFYDTRKKQRPFFQLQNWLFQTLFFSKFSVFIVATCARNTKFEVYCSFHKQTSLFYKTYQKIYIQCQWPWRC